MYSGGPTVRCWIQKRRISWTCIRSDARKDVWAYFLCRNNQFTRPWNAALQCTLVGLLFAAGFRSAESPGRASDLMRGRTFGPTSCAVTTNLHDRGMPRFNVLWWAYCSLLDSEAPNLLDVHQI